MRIVQVGPDESMPGGMRTVMLCLKNSILGDTYGMDIVGTASKSQRIQNFLRGFKRLKKIVASGNCDCVHIHMSENASVYRTALMTHWVKRHSCSRVIVQSHGGSVQSFFACCPRYLKERLLECLGMADLIVVLTPGWEEWWRDLLPSMKYEVMPNAVALPSTAGSGVADDSVVKRSNNILFMGKLGERKGTYLLISAAPKVLAEYPDARFIFAGDGEVEDCAAYAEILGVAGSCDFVGWADEEKKDRLLRNATLLALPSKEESFGIVLLEAMSYGVPVICSDGGFMHEVVDDGRDGIVFPTGDKDALAKDICYLLEDPDRRQAMGHCGSLKVEQLYSLSVVIGKWKTVYSEVMAS